MQIKPVKIGEIGRDFVKVENFLRGDVVLWQMLFYASLKSFFSLQICHMWQISKATAKRVEFEKGNIEFLGKSAKSVKIA